MKARRAKWVTTTTRANDGTVHVAVPKGALDQPNVPRGTRNAVRRGPVRAERQDERSAELVELGQLRGRVADLEERIVELRAELVEERAGRERDRVEARLERERLMQMAETMAKAARPVSWFDKITEWLGRKPSEGR
ncbi:MAG: hypothetical protein ACK51V_00070 [bacterium]